MTGCRSGIQPGGSQPLTYRNVLPGGPLEEGINSEGGGRFWLGYCGPEDKTSMFHLDLENLHT